MSEASQRPRVPLADVQNVTNTTRGGAAVASRKPAIKRTPSLITKVSDSTKRPIEKKSLLPNPSSRRTTRINRRLPPSGPTSSARAADEPVPRRLTAKPQPGSSSQLLRSQVSNELSTGEGGREQARLRFTQTRGQKRNLQPEKTSQDSEMLSKLADMWQQANLAGAGTNDLKNKVEQLTADLQSVKNQTEGHSMKSSDIMELMGKVEAAQTKAAETAEELLNEKLKAATVAGELSVVQQSVERLQKEKDDACASLNAKTEEVAKLGAVLEKTSEQQKDLENKNKESQSEVKRLGDMLQQAATNAEGKDSKLNQITERNSTLEQELNGLRRWRDEMEKEFKSLDNRKQQMEKELEEKQAKIASLEASVAEHTASWNSLKEESEAELKRYREEYDPKLTSLQKDHQQLSERNSTLEEENKCHREEIEQLKQTMKLQESRTSAIKSEKMNGDLRIESLESDVKKLEKERQESMKQSELKDQEILTLQEQTRKDAIERRKLHNTIQELKGNIRVFCRVRPLLESEVDSDNSKLSRSMFEYNKVGQGIVACHPTMKDDSSSSLSTAVQRHPFKFDKVFDPQSTQDSVFEEISQLVQSALDGYRVCIFAYGQTGSGKTHTMLGQSGENDCNLGMIPRSVRQIFESAKDLEKDGWKFELSASFVEIYNESLNDLLGESSRLDSKKSKDEIGILKISYDPKTCMSKVNDLSEVSVTSEEQVQHLINKAIRNRATAATKANDHSSRSHSVFRLHIRGKNSDSGETLHGLLNLIDLAGSERLAQSQAEGERFRETRHINKSLSALGKVITSISEGSKHIPFRDSKLTYLLQDSLGGNSKALMFVNISHAMESFNESLCSLRFAAKVNNCHVGTAKRSAKVDS